MAEVTGKTAAAMDAIANASITGGAVNPSGHLILTDHGGGQHDAGSVVGPQGPIGPAGPQGPAGVMPAGTIIMFATGGPPAGGWLVCNGAAVSRTTYSGLFALIGTRYGAGDGATTFNVPNFSGRFPRQDPAYGSNAGVTGGADTHVHLEGPHDHDLANGSPLGVAHIDVTATASPNIFMDRADGQATWSPSHQMGATFVSGTPANNTSGAKLAGHTGSTDLGNTGSSSNDPPYLNVAFFIKY